MKSIDKFLAIAVVVLWGFNFVVIRWGIEDVDPVSMTVLRFLLISIPLIFFVKKPEVSMKIVALYGILFGGGIWGLVNLAVSLNTPAGAAALLLQMSVFLSVAAAFMFLGEKATMRKLIGIAIAFAGFVLVCLFRAGTVPLSGIGLVFLAALFWTLCNIIIKLAKPKNIVSFIVWSSLFVPIPIVMFSFGFSYIYDGGLSWNNSLRLPGYKGWLSIAFQAYVTTLFGYGMWTSLINKYGLSKIAPFSLLVPVSGMFLGWILYQENYPIMVWGGSALIISGLFVLSGPFFRANSKGVQ